MLDAIQPCSKGPGGGGVFPGLLGPAMPVGRGTTHVLRGAAVLAAGFLPRAQEAVIDMSGPAAPLSPLAATHNLVVEWTPAEDADWGDVEVALRRGLVKVAAHLAEAALDAEPDAVEELAEPNGSTRERQAARRGHPQPADPGQVQGRLRLRAQPVRRPADRHLARRARRRRRRQRAVRPPRAQEPDDPASDASRGRRAARRATSSSSPRSSSAPSPSIRPTRSSSPRTPRGCASG